MLVAFDCKFCVKFFNFLLTISENFQTFCLIFPSITFLAHPVCVCVCACADSVINRFAGDGNPGYVDGKAGNSRFDKPRGFTVDAKGNVYVADKTNKAIRKISSSGV